MYIKNRNLFRINRIFLLKLPWLLRFLGAFRRPSKRLLIIKTDAIGDYILFRNFLEAVSTSALYKDYKIDVVGNVLWRDIAITYDSPFIDEFIFIKAHDLYEAPIKTLKLGWRLFRKNYEIVFQPTYARTLINDSIAALTGTKHIIGFLSDNDQIPERYKVKSDKFYSELLTLTPDIFFEFERTKFFFESVLKNPVPVSAPSITYNATEKSGIVIFAGAGYIKRGWEKEKFCALLKLIFQHTGQPVTLLGGPQETDTGNYLAENLPSEAINNLIGKTSLPELINIIGNSSLLIANETSAIHIAAATKTRAVCILGGGHYERFAPYPLQYENRPVCVYEKMECYNCNWNCIFKTEDLQPFPCISNVSVVNVWQEVLPMLS
jgi:ADP-heptose:LPS heptosyltransferase